jgi:hypothetical protein
MSLNPKYRLYLRHYNEGISESVMFFIPNWFLYDFNSYNLILFWKLYSEIL